MTAKACAKLEIGRELLYLSGAEIEAVAVPPRDLAASVDEMLVTKAAGETISKPKLGLYPAPGTFFQAMAGVLQDPPFAGIKWTGVVHDNDARGLPHVSPLVLLNDRATGVPIALLDGKWITTHRTAAITAVGAKYLARPDSTSIGFIACGVQARSHLNAFRAAYPLERVRAFSRRQTTAESFAAEVREKGLEVEVVDSPRAALADMDIVISSVPESPGLRPFLDPAWLAPGAYAGMTDVSRSWIPDHLRSFDILATDDHDQSRSMVEAGRLAYAGPFDADLAELAVGTAPGRTSTDQRTALIFSGLALADVAVAGLLYRRAREAGAGTILPL